MLLITHYAESVMDADAAFRTIECSKSCDWFGFPVVAHTKARTLYPQYHCRS